MKILLCYDGSPHTKAAVRLASGLFGGDTAIILTVWEDLSEVVERAGSGLAVASLDFEGIDRARARAASECAQEGAGHARAAGMPASALAVRCGATISETILNQAAEVDADVIVLGSRGLGTVKSVWLGSVSRAVLHGADRPVLVIPAPEVAVKRSGPRRTRRMPVDREFFSARL
jgi:nucleotide-binding universal stress UspA family protein